MFLNSLVWVALGAVIGSFLGALSWRQPRKVSIFQGRSKCPNCRKQIAWYDNIPILSYFILKGRCRHCRRKISGRYPLIEAGTAVFFLASSLYLPFSLPKLLLFLIFGSLLIGILVIDFEHQIIPDGLIALSFLTALAFYLTDEGSAFYSLLLAGLGASAFLLAVHLLTKGKGMGLGDVKFALPVGFFLGPKDTFLWLFVSFLTGASLGIILILAGRAKLRKPIAFGPYLVIGFFSVIFFGRYLALWILPF